MIATITFNPSPDEHIGVDRLVVEETNLWVKLRRYPGGKGFNVSRAILIKPNTSELETLLGRQLPTEEAIIQAALDLVATGIKIVVVSRGQDGIIATDGKHIFKAEASPVKVRSTVSAGDCAVAGLALKLAYGESLLEACRLGVAILSSISRQHLSICSSLSHIVISCRS